jgi:antitoxin MazE
MQIAKWGNSLAVRLPKKVVDELGLQEGDDVLITPNGKKALTVARDTTREEALKKMRGLQWEIPKDYKFNREEAHERGYVLDNPKPYRRK